MLYYLDAFATRDLTDHGILWPQGAQLFALKVDYEPIGSNLIASASTVSISHECVDRAA